MCQNKIPSNLLIPVNQVDATIQTGQVSPILTSSYVLQFKLSSNASNLFQNRSHCVNLHRIVLRKCAKTDQRMLSSFPSNFQIVSFRAPEEVKKRNPRLTDQQITEKLIKLIIAVSILINVIINRISGHRNTVH